MTGAAEARLDGRGGESYSPVVRSDAPQRTTARTAAASSLVRRRRPPSAEEQARRVAWGNKWGAMVSAEWKRTLQEDGGA